MDIYNLHTPTRALGLVNVIVIATLRCALFAISSEATVEILAMVVMVVLIVGVLWGDPPAAL